MTDPTERALALASEALPAHEYLRPAVARVIQGVMDERDALKREVKRLKDNRDFWHESCTQAWRERDAYQESRDKLRTRDQRIRELAAATGEAQRFQLEARFETKLDCLLDAIEETP